MTDAAWVALSLVRGIGGVTLRALLETFGSVDAILEADERSLRQVRGVGPKTASAILQIDRQQMARRIAYWQSKQVQLIPLHSPDYPPRLRGIPDAPPTLFVLGKLPDVRRRCVAVVGTRTPQPDSIQQAWEIGAWLAERQVSVVSGLALGIDSAAHRAAVSLPHTLPIGVLGGGVLRPYPPENRELIATIQRHGTLLAEVAPDATVNAAGLVARNRMISGLCEAVVIIETAADGGAMYAARAALQQGRRLFAMDNAATGNRALIDNGQAHPLNISNLASVLD